MSVVSGAVDKEKVHYEAIEQERVQPEMDIFLKWLNDDHTLDPVLKSWKRIKPYRLKFKLYVDGKRHGDL